MTGPGAPTGEAARPNRHREAVEAALAAAADGRVRLADAFHRLFAVADEGGWQGRAASDWRRQAEQARTATLGTVDAFADACRRSLAGQPEWVPADDPRARHPGPALPAGGR
ncbi:MULTISPECIES: hypothetical protein [unclassified Parafrankia]|uniref:hypothetical protein n=1 Tax=unclassified Parafrankia TaxID=2994368 RepID=UPI000DA4BA27|nr:MULTISPECIES: hypothetical protein [unclassified Parafrankia]TCJ36172.1 hypothetical protein E0504_24470 [Parafrankia sp. BMG5.11]CAI7977880.1 conserved hypothetical protein [Frankia sp. Hr75.2]SQD98183.1 conserved hypothetical protein [Parafrankia sp. Ea1.12]